MARDDPPFKVRFPGDLRDRIAEAAKAANRSMNAEIVARLEASFEPGAGGLTQEVLVDLVSKAAGETVRKLAALPPEELAKVLGIIQPAPPSRPPGGRLRKGEA